MKENSPGIALSAVFLVSTLYTKLVKLSPGLIKIGE
jgi:hypothetical protein